MDVCRYCRYMLGPCLAGSRENESVLCSDGSFSLLAWYIYCNVMQSDSATFQPDPESNHLTVPVIRCGKMPRVSCHVSPGSRACSSQLPEPRVWSALFASWRLVTAILSAASSLPQCQDNCLEQRHFLSGQNTNIQSISKYVSYSVVDESIFI